MKHELWYSVVVRDRHGKVISRERRKSKSFLEQWNQLIYNHMASVNSNIADTGGVPRNVGRLTNDFAMNAPLGNADYGIRVGTGNTAVAIDDFALEFPITEGVGAGLMEHLVCTITVPAVAAPSCTFLVSRPIVNNSGGVITVREAGIYMRMATFYFCGIRDVLTVPQAVPDGGSITIDWTIGVTV
ncbi:hypothetical protein ES703_49666 [subsurface metagenome]